MGLAPIRGMIACGGVRQPRGGTSATTRQDGPTGAHVCGGAIPVSPPARCSLCRERERSRLGGPESGYWVNSAPLHSDRGDLKSEISDHEFPAVKLIRYRNLSRQRHAPRFGSRNAKPPPLSVGSLRSDATFRHAQVSCEPPPRRTKLITEQTRSEYADHQPPIRVMKS
jgi:hypothetical protein